MQFKNGFLQKRKNCFVNVVMQGFLSLETLFDKLSIENEFEKELYDLFMKEREHMTTAIDLTDLKRRLNFNVDEQHDCEEYI